jgi:hypothetical protein
MPIRVAIAAMWATTFLGRFLPLFGLYAGPSDDLATASRSAPGSAVESGSAPNRHALTRLLAIPSDEPAVILTAVDNEAQTSDQRALGWFTLM